MFTNLHLFFSFIVKISNIVATIFCNKYCKINVYITVYGHLLYHRACFGLSIGESAEQVSYRHPGYC